MKKISIILFLIVFTLNSIAQIQNGYVRSQGTSTNPNGKRLSRVKVNIKGLHPEKVTDVNGNFNFNLGGGKRQFTIISVKRNEYRLLDKLSSSYNVGPAPIEIVMQSLAERAQNERKIRQDIERNISDSYNTKMEKLLREIVSLKNILSKEKQNSQKLKAKIGELEKQRELVEDQYQQRNELIDRMVEEYVDIDYAKLNDSTKMLRSFIESGELEKADSILNRIDIKEAWSNVRMLPEQIKEDELKAMEYESKAIKGKEKYQQSIEKLCSYYLGKYDVSLQKMQFDSAGVYIKQLVEVDTTNVDNLFTCAHFFHTQKMYEIAENYYLRGINILNKVKMDDKRKAALDERLASFYNGLASLYIVNHRFIEGENMLNTAIEMRSLLAKNNPEYEPDLANSYNNLASAYCITKQFKKSEDMYKAALEIYNRLVNGNPQTFEPYLAMSYNNIANLYKDMQRFSESEDLYKVAIEIRKRLAKGDPQKFEPDLAVSYSNLAILYGDMKHFDESENFAKAAIEIRKRLAKGNPKKYEPDLADSYYNLAILYGNMKHFDESEEINKIAINLFEKLTKNTSYAYRRALAYSYNNLAISYSITQRFSESEIAFKKAIKILEQLAMNAPKTYESDIAKFCTNLGGLYNNTHKYIESEEIYRKAIAIYEQLDNNNAYQEELAHCYYWFGFTLIQNGKYIESKTSFLKSSKYSVLLIEQGKETPFYAGSLRQLILLYGMEKDYKTAYTLSSELFKITTELEYKTDAWKSDFFTVLYLQSHYANLTSNFKVGELCAKEALNMDSTKHAVYAELAASLLFQCKTKEAEKFYFKFKYELKDVFLDDFAEYERLKIIPKECEADVEKIKKMLLE